MNYAFSLFFLALVSTSAFAEKTHWVILESDDSLTVQEEQVVRNFQDFSPKQKEKMIKQARSMGRPVDEILVMHQEQAPSRVKAPKVKCEASAAYCASLDSLRALNDSVLNCPQIQIQGILTSGALMPGDSIYGIDAACVKNGVHKVLDQAQAILVDDRNLDWLASALSLSERCYINRHHSLYCDAVDFSRRSGFVDDLINQLKKGPRPIHFEVTTTSSVQWEGETIALAKSIASPTSSVSSSREQMIQGEYSVIDINPRQTEYAEKEVIMRRGAQMGVIYPRSSTHDDYAFSVGEMQGECARLGGALVLDPKQGPGAPHVGLLRSGLDRYVYYLGSCKIPN